MQIDRSLLHETLSNARATLLAARGGHGHWVGELSASALSTATAVFTFALAPPTERRRQQIVSGLRWLADHQNADGGWGDTVLSVSNISTTALGWAVFSVADAVSYDGVRSRAEGWLSAAAGSLHPPTLAKAIADRYGKDRTFSVPILTMLALADRLGTSGWRLVPQLPFELAALPFGFFQTVRLPVVSYALPALIAMGQVRHRRRPSWNPMARFIRWAASSTTLRKLRDIQPTTGGYLEATPLTSFVTMSLLAAGLGDHPSVPHALDFLEQSVRPDGCWPIDTNLATWVTTLSVNALGDALPTADRPVIREWLLNQQYRAVHPYTRAAPGGWAWTDLSGGVPDADDTPGALLALARLASPDSLSLAAANAGVRWLLDLQNTDGGIPTFCRGWTGLPFDRSSNDLTAHTVLAWAAWRDHVPPQPRAAIDAATSRAVGYLRRTQRPDGAWAPLWFGNQHAAEIENLTYGTSRVLRLATLERLSHSNEWVASLARGVEWLQRNQNPDGGWGGRAGTPSSVEETGLALEGLAVACNPGLDVDRAMTRGVQWLADATRRGTHFSPSPIGFYFANLWYFEALYPVVFAVAGLSRIADRAGLASNSAPA